MNASRFISKHYTGKTLAEAMMADKSSLVGVYFMHDYN
jgi:hypothetical protein